LRIVLILAAACLPTLAALTEQQRVQDFEALAGIYAKSYGAANWKIAALNINIFDTSEWLKRVRAAKNDLEHVQILMEYAASFQDTHTAVSLPSNFLADLGFYCDLYDGKVYIDVIDRALLPQRDYPFAIGDELVSIDNTPALELAAHLARGSGWGNPRAAQRFAIQGLTFRAQSQYPLAVNLPDESSVTIRRQSGELEVYVIPWNKSGFPLRDLGAASSSFAVSQSAIETEELPADRPAWRRLFFERRLTRLPASRQWFPKRSIRNEDGSRSTLESIRGFGRQTPIWALPAGFQQRLGRNSNDAFFTGTYIADGLRIGFIRLRDFTFFTGFQLNQLSSEINFMNNNTDGLVVDVMRNPGGFDCATAEAAAMLIPGGFRVGGVSVRPSLSWITDYDNALLEAEFFGDPDYIIETLRFQRDLMIGAFSNGRGMTGSIPSCSLDFDDISYSFAYRKPLILLVDDFSTSAADSFASLIQDNQRGKLIGTRTNGAGGNVTDTRSGPWSETFTSFTESVLLRDRAIETADFGSTIYVENVGVRPDLILDYMTTENLRSQGRPFVEAFTKVIVDEIRAAP